MADPTFPVGEVIPTVDWTYHDEDTLFKVQAAITGLGYSGQPVLDIIAAMQNKGILFRERRPEGWLDKKPEPSETDRDLMPRVSQAWHDHPKRIRPELSHPEEPIEDRLHRAYTNGLQQGLTLGRNILGRWDHS